MSDTSARANDACARCQCQKPVHFEAYESVTRYTLQHATKSSTKAFDKALGEDSLETRRNKHPLEAYKSVTRYTLQQVISESPTTVGTYTHYVQSTLPDFPTNERGLRV